MKQVAVIQDISGLGRCSLAAALPVLSAMGVQCCPVPTAVYTNQTGFRRFAVLDCEVVLKEFPAMWKENGAAPDAIYTGFLSSPRQLEAVQAIVDTFRRPGTLLLADPVMGDNGARYPGFDDALCSAIAQFAAQADVITPNVTEACILTGMDYDNAMDEKQIRRICESLPQKQIVVTGWRRGNCICNAAWENGDFTVYTSPARAGSWSGTGDLFASALCGGLVKGDGMDRAIRRAVHFLELSLATATGRPEAGVPFEAHLKELMD